MKRPPGRLGYVARVLIDPEKCQFLFGADEPPFDVDELDAMLDLSEGATATDMRSALLGVVSRQVIEDRPAETWTTVRRLLDLGLSREAVAGQLLLVLTGAIQRTLGEGGSTNTGVNLDGVPLGYDEKRYLLALARLPMPTPDQVADAVNQVVAQDQGSSPGQITRRALAILGREPDDESAAFGARSTIEDGIEDGILVELSDDRIVHLPSLTSDIVLTHRITEAELVVGSLSCVGNDLAGFAWRGDVSIDGPGPGVGSPTRAASVAPPSPDPAREGSGSALAVMSVEPGHVAWEGPPGWLDHLRPGDLVAVRVGADTRMTIDVLDVEPGPDGRLLARLTDCWDDQSASNGLPVVVEHLVAALLLDDPSTFVEPRPPIVELCELAGLEVRGGFVASGDEMWDALKRDERFERISLVVDDLAQVEMAIDVLDELEDSLCPPAQLRSLLDLLSGNGIVCPVVVNELLEVDLVRGDIEAACAAAARLVEAARTPGQRALAHLIAAMIEERSGDVLSAEHHLELGVQTGARFGPLLDRRAWYASDRGDAATALRWWTIAPPLDDDDVEMVRRHVGRSGAKPGRNDPCWCGSERKYKTCHLGRPEVADLTDRVEWLWSKACSYLARRGGAAQEALQTLALAHRQASGRSVEPYDLDEDDVLEMMSDPAAIDLALVEGGWFARFVSDRGPLLPEDERELAASWVEVPRSVYELVSVADDGAIVVRDIDTGTQLSVHEPNLAGRGQPGDVWCARAVPDGRKHQFVGVGFPVTAGSERLVLEQCRQLGGVDLVAHVAGLLQ